MVAKVGRLSHICRIGKKCSQWCDDKNYHLLKNDAMIKGLIWTFNVKVKGLNLHICNLFECAYTTTKGVHVHKTISLDFGWIH
jgi:hypothetical protein